MRVAVLAVWCVREIVAYCVTQSESLGDQTSTTIAGEVTHPDMSLRLQTLGAEPGAEDCVEGSVWVVELGSQYTLFVEWLRGQAYSSLTPSAYTRIQVQDWLLAQAS